MSRYRGPRAKIIRRLGALPGLSHKMLGSRSGYTNQLTTGKKISQYRIRLEEKQKLRFHYGLTERQLVKYVRIARRAKGSTGQILLQLLEMRLDNIIFRLGMAPTIPSARQLVNHRHILINANTVNIPSYNCETRDIITIKNRHESQSLITKNMNLSREQRIPNHLTFDLTRFRGSVNRITDREWIGLKINELLVVEYYSRQV
uniref:ribosomal protein S4 n=1 Tax=Pallavicinia lyellii TaxID=56939 RepID=UPI001D1237AE|nr:ribosomal protein S4 [Pallavicinia lyellii]QZZ24692.1 ribosomal protein S4 [Pallavicinia lyellii]QZZ24776.1 ribosomal protein S4 [Pallavicinia lyellii]